MTGGGGGGDGSGSGSGMKSTLWVLGALSGGLVLGALLAGTENPYLRGFVALVEPVGVVWVNAIRVTVIPLVFSLLVVAVASRRDPRTVGRLGVRAVALFTLLLAAGGAFTAFTAPSLLAGLDIDPSVASELRASAESAAGSIAATVSRVPSLRDRLVGIVPSNVVAAASEGAILPVIVFALAFALAAGRLPPAPRETLTGFFDAVGRTMLVLVGWVLAAAPVGVFALAVGLASQMGFRAAGAIFYYVAVLSALLFAFTLALYPVVSLVSGTSLARFGGAAAPAQAVGATTRSSLAALPAMLQAARGRLDLDPEASGFLVPLAVSIFRVNVPIAWVVGVLFLGKLYGVPIDAGALATLVATSVLISFSVPGLPSASLYLMAPVLAEMGLPPEGVGILIAVDVLPDVFKTTANVTSHLTAATILAPRGKKGVGSASSEIKIPAP
jgi:Na+/H+-dicarboxylate symporter